MSVKCAIIPENCIACGLCQVISPEIFDYNDEGIILFKQEPEALHQFIDTSHLNSVKKAYRKCPVRAITIEEK